MSAANVRHHLSVLTADGRITMIGVMNRKVRGRPLKVYRLSDKTLGDNLPLLTSSLMTSWQKTLPPPKRESQMHSLAKELVDQKGRTNPDEPLGKRLTNLLDKLNEMHYQARWEAGAEGPRILFGHCPYAAIIDQHPELCQMDGFLLGDEMRASAQQLAKIDPKPGGATHCIFLIK
jgi:predicted ArsR family transcriptional regulator